MCGLQLNICAGTARAAGSGAFCEEVGKGHRKIAIVRLNDPEAFLFHLTFLDSCILRARNSTGVEIGTKFRVREARVLWRRLRRHKLKKEKKIWKEGRREGTVPFSILSISPPLKDTPSAGTTGHPVKRPSFPSLPFHLFCDTNPKNADAPSFEDRLCGFFFFAVPCT